MSDLPFAVCSADQDTGQDRHIHDLIPYEEAVMRILAGERWEEDTVVMRDGKRKRVRLFYDR
jgi:hypothetical protein